MNGSRRLDLDGLRGLAVLLVVGFHAGLPALRGAFVAVDVFFVLSGFFLAVTLTRRLATGKEIRSAQLVAGRVWRLLPVLVMVLLGTLATTLLYAPIDRAAVAARVAPVAAFAGNLAFAADGVNYFQAGQNPLLHTWMLGVELQLALLFPLLVMLFAAWGERLVGAETGAERRWIVMRTVLRFAPDEAFIARARRAQDRAARGLEVRFIRHERPGMRGTIGALRVGARRDGAVHG